jgi:hypothetical protein
MYPNSEPSSSTSLDIDGNDTRYLAFMESYIFGASCLNGHTYTGKKDIAPPYGSSCSS